MARLLVRLINDDRDGVRILAGQYLAKVGFDNLWESWPRLRHLQQLAAGRALIKIHPLFHARLADKLAHPDRGCRLRALSIIHGLNQGALFERAIVMLASGTDPVVAASAVRALGSISSPATAAGLERALEHRDSRVRANAIEALQELGLNRHRAKLLAMARQEDSRPRANAIGALLPLQTLDALNLLATMLADPRPQQRTSALWLVEAAGLIDLARHVAEISLADPDQGVRTRAAGVIQKMVRAAAGAGGEAQTPPGSAPVPRPHDLHPPARSVA
jgi:HEAT repeat protein